MKRVLGKNNTQVRTLRAFTLIELLAVVAVIGILSGLLVSSIARSRARGKRISCLSNLRQLGIASNVYAHDDSKQSLSAKQESEDQNLNWLLAYAGNAGDFVCPSTKNYVRTNVGIAPYTFEVGLEDLFRMATDRQSAGMSYQGFGFLGVGVGTSESIPVYGGTRVINGIRKNLNSVQTYEHFHNAFGLKGVIPGPSQLWIIADNALPGQWYYPDNDDNHGDLGANIGFCDGHAEWVDRASYIYKYELSQDEDRSGVKLTW